MKKMFSLMFPVCTGINREHEPERVAVLHVPCMHRDKPRGDYKACASFICSLYAQG